MNEKLLALGKRLLAVLLSVLIPVLAFIISAFLGLSPVYVVIAAGLTGFIFKYIRGEK